MQFYATEARAGFRGASLLHSKPISIATDLHFISLSQSHGDDTSSIQTRTSDVSQINVTITEENRKIIDNRYPKGLEIIFVFHSKKILNNICQL